MDELDLVRDLYGEQPADPRLRARVWKRVEAERRRAKRRLFGWTSLVAGLAAAALVLWLVPPEQPQGRTILLAAATNAASAPDGAYWHLKQRQGTTVTELWVARDGRAWTKDGSPLKTAAFSIAGKDLSFAQIQSLPTGADELRAWVRSMVPPGDDVFADALSGLLWRKPSPPGVRAAAYRLLADLPNVRYLGERADGLGRPGEAFSFALGDLRRTLIIDPASSQVLSSADDRQPEVVVEAAFTDRGPAA